MKQRAALYLRLSREDSPCEESSSILSQRRLLRAYAHAHDFELVGEYIDDGYSGTNFDRPAFQRLLAAIESHEIDIVLTKDLSRLGRDYLSVGQYTEQYFPLHGIRYIAVNDGYDSLSGEDDLLPLKNVINELYARDISKKIRSALRAKMEAGQYIGNFAPYGYQKDPLDHNHLIPDAAAARVVKEIFSRAAQGCAPLEIAQMLNVRGVPTPLCHRLLRLHRPLPDPLPVWSSSGICKILKNPVYLGHTAQGKCIKFSFKQPRPGRQPQERWIWAKNTHTALVEPALFLRVQQRHVPRKKAEARSQANPFAGLLFCGDCGRPFSIGNRTAKGCTLVCSGYKAHGRTACSSHRIDSAALLQYIQQQLHLSPAKTCQLCDVLSRIELFLPIAPEFCASAELPYRVVLHLRS